jgi:two-component system, NarL family, response regulator NreC
MSIRVFLADDHAVLRDGLRYLLQAQEDIIVVGEANNGRHAVEGVKALEPSVVLMDISMPELNGIEATRQIRQVSPSTRVVILSMYSTAEHVLRSLQAGAQGYLLKQSAGTEVVQAIYSVNSGRRYLSDKIAEMVIDDYVRRCEADVLTSPLERLSAREREVLQLVAEGKSSAEIAEALHLSVKSIETYRSRLMTKLGLDDITDLVRFAIQQGLIQND